MAKGEWQSELNELLAMGAMENDMVAEKLGFLFPWECKGARPEDMAEEDMLSTTLHVLFFLNLLGSRIVFGSCLEYALPWAAAGLLEEGHELQEQLKKFERWWKAWDRLQQEIVDDSEASSLLWSVVFQCGSGLPNCFWN